VQASREESKELIKYHFVASKRFGTSSDILNKLAIKLSGTKKSANKGLAHGINGWRVMERG
jgi:hypothetical protein